MNMREYKEALGRLEPGKEKKQQIWRDICALKYRNRHSWIKTAGISMATAAACMAILFHVYPAAASNVKDFFQGFFVHEDNEYLDQSGYNLSGNVKTNVFSDGDGHVSIDVLEMFSDGMTAFMTVKYTAIDETGREWMNDSTGIPVEKFLHLRPVIPGNNAAEYGVNWMSGGRLLEDMSTDTEKYYCVTMYASSIRYSSDTLAFLYPITVPDADPPAYIRRNPVVPLDADTWEYIREADFESASNMDFTIYEITGDTPKEAAYTPEYLYLSGLSYLVKGKNQMTADLDQPDIGLLFTDGSAYYKKCGSWVTQAEEGNTEEELVSGAFVDESRYKVHSVDPEEASKLILGDTEYRLRKIGRK